MRLRKFNKLGVAEVASIVFILAIESVVLSVSVYGISTTLESRVERLGELQAQNGVNSVADALIDAAITAQLFPTLTFTKIVEVPEQIGGRPYYFTINKERIYANSTDGAISINSTTYGVKDLDIIVYGKAYVYTGRVSVEYSNNEIVIEEA